MGEERIVFSVEEFIAAINSEPAPKVIYWDDLPRMMSPQPYPFSWKLQWFLETTFGRID